MGKVISVAMTFKDAFSNPCKETVKNLKYMGKEAMATGKSIQNAGKSITKVGSSLTKGITMPVVGIGVAAVKTAADFESAMTEVKVVAGATETEFAKLQEEAQRLGKTTKFSAIESAEAMQYMAQAGWDTKSILAGTEGVMNAAASSGEDLASVAEILSQNITAFGDTAKDANRYADVLSASAAVSAANITYLGNGFKYAAATAGSMGYSVEDISIAFSAMSNSGIKAETAGASLRNIISNMAKPTDSQAELMKKLGLSLTDSSGKTKSFATVMDNLRDAFSGMSKKQAAAAASTLAGKQSMSALLALVNTSDKDFKIFSDAIYNSTGKAKEMADEMQNNLNGQITLLKSSVEGAAITIGNKLLPMIKGLTSKIKSAADWFNNLSDKQVSFIMKAAGIAAVIGPVIMIIGKLVTTVGTAVFMYGKMSKAIGDAGGIMKILTGPAGTTIAVIAGLALVAIVVIKNWDKIKPALQKVANFLKQVFGPAFKSVGDFIKSNMLPIIAQVKKVVNQLKPVFTAIGNVTKKVFSAMAKFVNNNMGTIQKIVKAVTNRLIRPFKVAFAIITSIIQAALTSISDIIKSIQKVFKGITTFISGVFTGDWKKAWQGVRDIFSGIFETYANIVKMPLNAVINLINKAIGGINKACNIKVPDWVPVIGGKDYKFNIPTIPNLAHGTQDWKGGPVQVHERGGEIIDLPKGSRVYPHDESIKMAKNDNEKKVNIIIKKIADKVVINNDKDIDDFVERFADQLKLVFDNM